MSSEILQLYSSAELIFFHKKWNKFFLDIPSKILLPEHTSISEFITTTESSAFTERSSQWSYPNNRNSNQATVTRMQRLQQIYLSLKQFKIAITQATHQAFCIGLPVEKRMMPRLEIKFILISFIFSMEVYKQKSI